MSRRGRIVWPNILPLCLIPVVVGYLLTITHISWPLMPLRLNKWSRGYWDNCCKHKVQPLECHLHEMFQERFQPQLDPISHCPEVFQEVTFPLHLLGVYICLLLYSISLLAFLYTLFPLLINLKNFYIFFGFVPGTI